MEGDSFRSLGDVSAQVFSESIHRGMKMSLAKRRAEVFLAEVTRRHSVLVVIATGAPDDGLDAYGQLWFSPRTLPRLHALFDMRPLAGRQRFPGERAFVIHGVRP